MTVWEVHHAVQVQRHRTEDSSWIEPPLDQKLSELDQLKWQAGVVYVDTGIEVTISVHPGFFGDKYGLQFTSLDGTRRVSLAAMEYAYAWALMSHVSLGAELVQGRRS